MTDEKNELDPESDTFKSLRYFLEGKQRKVEIGVLATAIEDKENGIYTWDRFGRFGKADEAAQTRALDLLARCYEYEADPCSQPNVHDNPHPLDKASFIPDDPFETFGWYPDKLPDFKTLTQRDNAQGRNHPNPASPQQRAAATKKRDTLLVIIGALCSKAKINYTAPGAAKEIEKIMEHKRNRRDEDTILPVLKEVREVYEECAQ